MGECAAARGRAVSTFMDGYRAAWEDIQQALDNVPCRCQKTDTRGHCLIYRGDLDAIIEGALRGCPCEPP